MLKLKGLELESSGVYRVRVENEFEVKWENFTLIVTEPPQVCIYVHCTILNYADIEGVPKNMGIQWQIGYLLQITAFSVGIIILNVRIIYKDYRICHWIPMFIWTP